MQLLFAVWSGYTEWASTVQEHGGRPDFWSTDFWVFLAYKTNMSTLADTYGVLLIVLPSKWLTENGSSKSTQ